MQENVRATALSGSVFAKKNPFLVRVWYSMTGTAAKRFGAPRRRNYLSCATELACVWPFPVGTGAGRRNRKRGRSDSGNEFHFRSQVHRISSSFLAVLFALIYDV